MDTHTPRRIILGPDVESVTGLSRPSRHRMIQRGEFPAPVRLSSGRVGWYADEITAWQDSLPRATDCPRRTPVSPGRYGYRRDGGGNG